MPFSPRVDVALVGLDRRVGQHGRVEAGGGVPLEFVPQPQQLHPVALQLAGQPRRRHALGEAAEDQDEFGGAPGGLLQGRAGEGVEDPAAALAAVVEDRVAVAAMDAEAVGATPRAGQAVGVESPDEPGVAGGLVHQIGDREVHSGAHSVRIKSDRDSNTLEDGRQGHATCPGS
jgi:hypothetical protein